MRFALIAFLLAAVVAPAPAHAQLLKRLARAAEQAAGRADGAAPAPAASATPAAASAPTLVPITAARLDTFLVAMRPLLRVAESSGPYPDRAAVERAARQATDASRLTPAQLGLMRERIALYLLHPDKAPNVTPDERAAIDARRDALAPFVAVFQQGAMAWRTWNELWPRDPWARH